MKHVLVGTVAASLGLLAWHPVLASAVAVVAALACLWGFAALASFDARNTSDEAAAQTGNEVAALKAEVEELRRKVLPLINAASMRAAQR